MLVMSFTLQYNYFLLGSQFQQIVCSYLHMHFFGCSTIILNHLQVPYEVLNKRFRAAQKAIDREVSRVQMTGNDLEKCLQRPVTAGEVTSVLGTMVENLSMLKRKVQFFYTLNFRIFMLERVLFYVHVWQQMFIKYLLLCVLLVTSQLNHLPIRLQRRVSLTTDLS